MLRALNWVLLAAGFLIVAATIFTQADAGLGVFMIPLAGFFVALGFVPFAPFGILNRRLTHALPLALCTLALVGLSAFWLWGFGGTFWWNERPDAQDGLVILVLPVFMMVGAGPMALAAWGLDRYLTRRHS